MPVQAEVKAVIFDYGEVLTHRPMPEEAACLAASFGVAVDAFPALWEKNRRAFDRGDLTAQAYWSMLAADAGVQLRSREMEEIGNLDVAMWSHINPNMVDWARQLRASGIKIGVLSNMHLGMAAYVRKNFAWLEIFDFLTLSAEVRLAKPEAAIYEHTLRGLGATTGETLFLDDREVNIQAAHALGIRAIRFQSMAQLRSDLQAAGITLPPLPC